MSLCNLLPKSLNMVDPPDNTIFYNPSDPTLNTTPHIEEGYLIEPPPNINRRSLNNIIHNLRQRRQKITRRYLRIEENLGRQKSLIADVDTDLSPALLDVDALEARGVGVVAGEFLDDVGAYVGEFLFDAFCGAEGGGGFVAVAEEGLDEVGYVAAGDGDVFYARVDDIAFCLQPELTIKKERIIGYCGGLGGCTTGMTWVTPSPESMTVPVKERSVTLDEVHDAARARTACTAIYNP
jgi:hypothetical protein